jgi:integrase
MVKGFSPVELLGVFSLPIFTQAERPGGGKGEASYWMPLLMLMTGARPSEVAQLVTDNIWQEDGTWLIEYTDQGEHPAIGQKTLKTERSGSGRRTLPVPKRLLDLNLVGYVDHLKSGGETALLCQHLTASLATENPNGFLLGLKA